MHLFEKFLSTTLETYSTKDFPSLFAQIEEWKTSKPLLGLTVLDCTPIFENTIPKYAALLAGGATLSIGTSKYITYDIETLEFLKNSGIEIVEHNSNKSFDIVLDCGCFWNNTASKYGFSELTRTGVIRYENLKIPVFAADTSIVKEFETTLGTGDGFVRAMKQLGYSDFSRQNIMVFGCGKVGRGIIFSSKKLGAKVNASDSKDFENIAKKFGVSTFANMKDKNEVISCMRESNCFVAATGRNNAINIPEEFIQNKENIFVNMGVDDEYGIFMPKERVLNNKMSLNFILKEPTRLRYIDPSLALHNYGAIELLNNPPQSVFLPSLDLVKDILDTVRLNGSITKEEFELIGL